MRAPAIPGYVSQRRRMILESGGPDAVPDLKALDLKFTTGALDSRITFTRASTATYFDGAGRLRTATTNQPRFDYDPATLECKGLLIEESRTNLIAYSTEISNASWGTSPDGSLAATANAALAPDRTLAATRLETADTLSNSHIWFRSFTGSVDTAYVGSIYAKAGEYSRISVWFGNTAFASTNSGALFDLANGTVVTTTGDSVATITDVGDGWYRCSFTGTSDADGGNYVFGIAPSPADDTTVSGNYTPASTGLGLYVWGAQVEAGAFPTSYIPTVASSVTRAADSAIIDGTNFSSWFNASEGAAFVEASSVYGPTGFPGIFHCHDGTSGEVIGMTINATDNLFICGMTDGGVSQASINEAYSSGSRVRAALAYKLNDFCASVAGSTEATDTSCTVPTVDRLSFGKPSYGLNYLNGHIRRFTYYNTRLPNATLVTMTT